MLLPDTSLTAVTVMEYVVKACSMSSPSLPISVFRLEVVNDPEFSENLYIVPVAGLPLSV